MQPLVARGSGDADRIQDHPLRVVRHIRHVSIVGPLGRLEQVEEMRLVQPLAVGRVPRQFKIGRYVVVLAQIVDDETPHRGRLPCMHLFPRRRIGSAGVGPESVDPNLDLFPSEPVHRGHAESCFGAFQIAIQRDLWRYLGGMIFEQLDDHELVVWRGVHRNYCQVNLESPQVGRLCFDPHHQCLPRLRRHHVFPDQLLVSLRG